MKHRVVALWLALCAGHALAAEVLPAGDAGTLLKKIAAASRKLSYVGTYLHQHGLEVSTFRVAHVVDAEGELEKREPLEGSAREIVRSNGQVSSYFPDAPANPAEVKRNTLMKLFPALINDDSVESSVHYVTRRLPNERVAGIDCQVLMLDPKDSFRYGHKVWFDQNTALLMKIASLNARLEIVEQFAFTEVSIDSIDRKSLKPRYPHRVDIFTPDRNRQEQTKARYESGWEIRNIPPGYRIVRESKATVGNNVTRVSHLWLSDGWGAISVFVEPPQASAGGGNAAAAEPAALVSKASTGVAVRKPVTGSGLLVSQGIVNVVSRNSADASVVVMGDVPEAAVVAIAGSVVQKPQPKAAH